VEGEVHMPALDPQAWDEIAREDHSAATGLPGFSFVTLERR